MKSRCSNPKVDLRKTLVRNPDGSITKRDPERHGEYFDVTRVRVASLGELRAAFETAGSRIFIHGRPKPTTPMRSTRRKSELFDDEPHRFIVLDVDDFEATSNDPAIAAQEVRALLPNPFRPPAACSRRPPVTQSNRTPRACGFCFGPIVRCTSTKPRRSWPTRE